MRRIVIALLLAAGLAALVGCGNKGPLVRPPAKAPPPATTVPVPATPVPAAMVPPPAAAVSTAGALH